MSVDIRVTVTDAEYRKLLIVATNCQTQVHKLIEAQLRSVLSGEQPKPRRTGEKRRWVAVTDAERARMVELRASDHTISQIARVLNRPESTVALHLKNLEVAS